MKKIEEQVLSPHKHMAKTASPHHPHSRGLVYSPSGKKTFVRPIDSVDSNYGGETVADAQGGEANAGIASKKAVAPMPMQTLVKVRKVAEQFLKDRRQQSPENAVRRARLDAQRQSKGNNARAMGAALEEKKLTKAEMKKREEIAQAIERDQPGMDMSKKMAIATATAKRVAEDYRTQKAEKSQGQPNSNTAPKSVSSRGKVFTPEEAEQMDELKKSTLASYAKKATDDATYNSFIAGTMSAKNPARLDHDKKAMKRQAGVFQAVNRLAKEEIEQVDEAKHIVHVTVSDPNHPMVSKRKEAVSRRATVSADSEKSAVQGALHFYRKQGLKVHDHNYVGLKEENDGTDADEGEYGYEGDMAMSQLKSIIRNAKDLHDHMEPQTDLPEWLQSKITLAADYIQTAADYWRSEKEESEMSEEVWDKPMPDSERQGSLTPKQKAKARARATAAGRPYPNMVDNIWASRQ